MRTVLLLLLSLLVASPAHAGNYRFSVAGDQLQLNGQPFKVIGLRLSNALASDAETQELIDNLDTFRGFGVNTVSVFLMGSRFGDIQGYRPDASLDPVYAARLGRIIEAADQRGMVVLVGCLYWSTSTAKEHLDKTWTQEHANGAVANTFAWLRDHDYRNVFVDVDNEGMAHAAKKWDIAEMIDAAHAVDPTIMVAYNSRQPPPGNADLYIHHSPKVAGKPWVQTEGTPRNALGHYWGEFSKRERYYNYIRIGRYTPEMKEDQFKQTRQDIEQFNGHMLASTWLQCGRGEGVGGPFMNPGGLAESDAIDADVTALQPDAGVLWWLQYVKERYGPWQPAAAAKSANEKYDIHDPARPLPPIVTPGEFSTQQRPGRAPSDAVILFDGGSLDAWQHSDGSAPRWRVSDGAMIVEPNTGHIYTRQHFGDVQLHLEWAADPHSTGTGQHRSNSGVFLLNTYEVQILDNYRGTNKTYADGTAAAIYGRYPPLVNASRAPGEWQVYDIVFRRPRFDAHGRFVTPGSMTVLHNGVLVQDHVAIMPKNSRDEQTKEHDRLPIRLQDHKDDPIRFRNIWVRDLDSIPQAEQ